jgi:hypothetical protein
MTRRIQKHVGKVILSLVGLFCVAGGTGCDEYGLMGSYLGGYFPASTYYNPYNDIQSVIGYRQGVMDWSNDQWDAYIRE